MFRQRDADELAVGECHVLLLPRLAMKDLKRELYFVKEPNSNFLMAYASGGRLGPRAVSRCFAAK